MEPISTTEPSPTSRLEPKVSPDRFSIFTYAGSMNSVPPVGFKVPMWAVAFSTLTAPCSSVAVDAEMEALLRFTSALPWDVLISS